MPDTRVVYGVRCTWWDTIDKVGHVTPPQRFPKPGDKPIKLPCCPHCQGLLYEVPSLEAWMANVDQHEKNGHDGYRAFIEWMRGRCFVGAGPAKLAYESDTGKTFIL